MASATLPPTEHDTLTRTVSRFGLGDVLLDLAAEAEAAAHRSGDNRAIERRGEVATRLLSAAIAADRLGL